MSNVIEMKETQVYQVVTTETDALNWDVTISEAEQITKVIFNGITDYLAQKKNKMAPVAVLIQDLKGNNVNFGCVRYIPSDDDDSEGVWEYFWSFDTNDIPENADVHSIEDEDVLKTILHRGYNMCRMTSAVLNYIAVIAVIIMNAVKDVLDQQNVANGEQLTLDLPGFFEASVGIENGEKVFAISPKEEMKVLIKDDSQTE